jgi:diguanylate cyclase (GGDEF)-like protein/PAS domain S-box-containing protein
MDSGVRADDSSTLPRHPLERQALTDPQTALAGIEAALAEAEAAQDLRQQALLQVARANACRVIANWPCQRDSGIAATRLGEAADDPVLKVRGLIAEARAAIAMQDYSLGEERLANAEIVLRRHPNPELEADVALGYSSMSHVLGKHAVAADYAARGLAALQDPDRALPMRVRLLRNQARALAQLGDLERAQTLLQEASTTARRFEDPKLSAELYLERARLARLDQDYSAQFELGNQVMTLGRTLRNSQLLGLGREVLALAEADAGNREQAVTALQSAYVEFRDLNLHRDQLRVGRLLLLQLLERGEGIDASMERLIRELMALEENVIQADRAQSAAEFQSRLDYVQQQAEVARLETEAQITAQRAQQLVEVERISRWLAWATLAGLLILLVFFIIQRMNNQRLKRTLIELQQSRSQAREFLGLSSGLVCLHDLDGRIIDLNPSAAQTLGITEAEQSAHRLSDHVVPTADADVPRYLARLGQHGHAEGTLRFRQADASHAHWRYSARVLGGESDRRLVILQAVDVTDQVRQTEELRSMALHDPLTGCLNRRYLKLFELQQREQGWTAVVIDLDQFKQVNDERGHDYGDQVLRDFGAFLKAQARSVDAVVRSGGDEFVLLLPQPDPEAARALLHRLQQHATTASSAFSMGFAVRNGNESLASTIDRADRSMYGHKDRRRSRA